MSCWVHEVVHTRRLQFVHHLVCHFHHNLIAVCVYHFLLHAVIPSCCLDREEEEEEKEEEEEEAERCVHVYLHMNMYWIPLKEE